MAEPRCELAADARVGAMDAAALARAANALAQRLPAPTPGSAVAFAFDRDLAACATALLAVWQRGHTALLPASARRRHVGPALARPEVALLVHDTGAGAGLDVARFLVEHPHDGGAAVPLALAGPMIDLPPDGGVAAVAADRLADRIRRTIAELQLRPGLRVANLCPPALAPALVSGLLAPLAAGAIVHGHAGAADLVVAPRGAPIPPAAAGTRVVAIDAPPEPPAAPVSRAPLTFAAVTPTDSEGARYRAAVPIDFFGFAGHFPGYPVLSGAVQLHELVLPCLRAVLGDTFAVTAFHDLKFLARIAPGDTVEVALRPAAGRCDFTITRGDVRCSTGRAVLAEGTP